MDFFCTMLQYSVFYNKFSVCFSFFFNKIVLSFQMFIVVVFRINLSLQKQQQDLSSHVWLLLMFRWHFSYENSSLSHIIYSSLIFCSTFSNWAFTMELECMYILSFCLLLCFVFICLRIFIVPLYQSALIEWMHHCLQYCGGKFRFGQYFLLIPTVMLFPWGTIWFAFTE